MTPQNSGICIPAGGNYATSAYITIRLIRHLGCNLPIEYWHLGADECQGWTRDSLDGLNVDFVDAHHVMERHGGFRVRGGWELKPLCVLHSKFRHVLYLDADSYPCRNPEFLFESPQYAEHGAIFWPDHDTYKPSREFWKALGIRGDGYKPIESGQLLVDRERCWRPLNLVAWMCQHSDFYFKLVHGDKDLWGAAWRYFHHEYVMPSKMYTIAQPAMIQYGFDGQPLFIHRASGKFTLGDPREFHTTRQSVSQRNDKIPMEAEAWRFLEELRSIRDRGNPVKPLVVSSTGQRIMHGVAGLAKALSGTDRPPESVIANRREVCESCPELQPAPLTLGITKQCAACGCAWPQKLFVAGEHCPNNLWPSAGESRAYIQLGRIGDCLCLMPALKWLAKMGIDVTHIVSPQYAELTKDLPWCRQLIYNGGPVDPFGAQRWAREQGLNPVITMVGNNDPVPRPKGKTFAEVQWERSGVPLDLFNKLPLEIENRNTADEYQIVAKNVTNDRPIILFNASHFTATGRPAGFKRGPQLLEHLRTNLPHILFIDLGRIRAKRLIDLCGLYELAKGIVSTDTATIHLGKFNELATVGIVLDDPYMRSPRRPHWMAEFTYAEAAKSFDAITQTVEGLAQ